MKFAIWLESRKKIIHWTDFEEITPEQEQEVEEAFQSGKLQPEGTIVLKSGDKIHWIAGFACIYVLKNIPIEDLSPSESNQHQPAVDKWLSHIEDRNSLDDPVTAYASEWRGTIIYVLQDGHHRYRAATAHGLTSLPTWVKIADVF